MLFMLVAQSAISQDLIVKKSGEIILCSIEKVDDHFIHFYEIPDTSKLLLYKMDVALVSKVAFATTVIGVDVYPEKKSGKDALTGSRHMIETNVDGIFNNYLSIFYQFVKPGFAVDVGYKRYNAPRNFLSQNVDDSGLMMELGVSFPMKLFGKSSLPYRGIYLRGFGIYTNGDFMNGFQAFNQVPYEHITFGAQGVFSYQVSNGFYLKAYFGLAGTKRIDRFSLPSQRADLSGGDGLQSIYGMRVGYIF